MIGLDPNPSNLKFFFCDSVLAYYAIISCMGQVAFGVSVI